MLDLPEIEKTLFTRNPLIKGGLTSSTALIFLNPIKISPMCRHSTKLIDDPGSSTNKILYMQNSLALLITKASNCREHFVLYHEIVNTISDFKNHYESAKEARILIELSKFILNLHIDFQNYNEALNELVFLVFF